MEKDAQILILEDEEAIATPLAKLLSLQGFQPILALSGMEAQQVLSKRLPAVILLDVMMPDMNGWTFREWLRSQPEPIASIPLIFLSADVNSADRAREVDEAFVIKPIDLDLLLKTIDKKLKHADVRLKTLSSEESIFRHDVHSCICALELGLHYLNQAHTAKTLSDTDLSESLSAMVEKLKILKVLLNRETKMEVRK